MAQFRVELHDGPLPICFERTLMLLATEWGAGVIVDGHAQEWCFLEDEMPLRAETSQAAIKT